MDALPRLVLCTQALTAPRVPLVISAAGAGCGTCGADPVASRRPAGTTEPRVFACREHVDSVKRVYPDGWQPLVVAARVPPAVRAAAEAAGAGRDWWKGSVRMRQTHRAAWAYVEQLPDDAVRGAVRLRAELDVPAGPEHGPGGLRAQGLVELEIACRFPWARTFGRPEELDDLVVVTSRSGRFLGWAAVAPPDVPDENTAWYGALRRAGLTIAAAVTASSLLDA